MRKVAPVSPGEMLEEVFLILLGMTQYRLAKEIGAPPRNVLATLLLAGIARFDRIERFD